MRQYLETLGIATGGSGLLEFTRDVARIVKAAGIESGVAHIFCRHTSASLVIQENADPDVQRDLVAFFERLVPDGDSLFVHRSEGPDDMPAHVKSALTQTSLAIPIADFQMMLGTWQGIYLFEHRRKPHTRQIVVHVLGQ
jgi:secondary thiamine-phosphate synthase enzyme